MKMILKRKYTMERYPSTVKFTAVSIILPVMNETDSLIETMETIMKDCSVDEIKELIIVICDHTKPESLGAINIVKERWPGPLKIYRQRLPFLGGAIREAFDLAEGSHVIMMASDLETNPHDVSRLIRESRNNPNALVTASRWQKGGKFQGYSTAKLIANWIFQNFFSLLYGTKLSDMTFGYRIFPTTLVKSINWEELRHPFLFETLIKPLRLGVPVIEIASVWKAREEGESQNSFFRNFVYFRTGIKTRFADPRQFLKT
jgi:glycosyltransferase involved in cell wall biosynthesis